MTHFHSTANQIDHAKSADLKSHSADDDWELKVAKQYVEAVVTEWSIDIQ